jgi:hypothetical protein
MTPGVFLEAVAAPSTDRLRKAGMPEE